MSVSVASVQDSAVLYRLPSIDVMLLAFVVIGLSHLYFAVQHLIFVTDIPLHDSGGEAGKVTRALSPVASCVSRANPWSSLAVSPLFI